MATVDLPLHRGRAPYWLFKRMVSLARAISLYIIEEYSPRELVRRLSNPFWFQSLSLVLGFDWHSSGTTTTTIGALVKATEDFDCFHVVGGKGKHGIHAQERLKEILSNSDVPTYKEEFILTSDRLSAKVDSSIVQDGYEIYLHSTFFSEDGEVGVVNQGMNVKGGFARRYHWTPEELKEAIYKPHSIVGKRLREVFHLLGEGNEALRKDILSVVEDGEMLRIRFPRRHAVMSVDLTKRDLEFFQSITGRKFSSFKELALVKGLGKKRLRALALISSLIYGHEGDWRDPVKYAYAHGGKDGIPFPVDRKVYDDSISFLSEAVENAKVEERLRERAKTILRRLYREYFSSLS